MSGQYVDVLSRNVYKALASLSAWCQEAKLPRQRVSALREPASRNPLQFVVSLTTDHLEKPRRPNGSEENFFSSMKTTFVVLIHVMCSA